MGRNAIDPEIIENTFYVASLRLGFGVRDVPYMENEVGFNHLFQRRTKSGHQRRRQVGNEPDGIG